MAKVPVTSVMKVHTLRFGSSQFRGRFCFLLIHQVVAVYKLCCVGLGCFFLGLIRLASGPSFNSQPIISQFCTGFLRGKETKGFKHPSEGLPKLVPCCRCFLVMAEITLHWKSTSTACQRMTSTSEAELEHFHPANICRKKRETLNLQQFCIPPTSFY